MNLSWTFKLYRRKPIILGWINFSNLIFSTRNSKCHFQFLSFHFEKSSSKRKWKGFWRGEGEGCNLRCPLKASSLIANAKKRVSNEQILCKVRRQFKGRQRRSRFRVLKANGKVKSAWVRGARLSFATKLTMLVNCHRLKSWNWK